MTMVWWIPALLLVLVAMHQRWRMASVHQSAWKGGGFGMFSDIQRCSVAAVAWVREDDYRLTPLRLDPSAPLAKVTHIPTARNIRQWGEELAAVQWQRCGQTAHELAPGSGDEAALLEKITLHRLEIDFDGRHGMYAATEHDVCTIPAPRRAAVTP
jgi:hypothetical protein